MSRIGKTITLKGIEVTIDGTTKVKKVINDSFQHGRVDVEDECRYLWKKVKIKNLQLSGYLEL